MNNYKKITLALCVSICALAAQAMDNGKERITKENITKFTQDDEIRKLIEMEDIDYLLNCITKENIASINRAVVYYILCKNAQSSGLKEKVIPRIQKYILSCITKDNFEQIDPNLIQALIFQDTDNFTAIKHITQYLNIKSNAVGHLLTHGWYEKVHMVYVFKCLEKSINEQNISTIDPTYLKILLEINRYAVKDFRLTNTHTQRDRKNQIEEFIKDLSFNNDELNKNLFSCITKNNFASIPKKTYELLIKYGLDLKSKLEEVGYSLREQQQDFLDSYLLEGKTPVSVYFEDKLSGWVDTCNDHTKNTTSHQLFASTFAVILDFFESQLEPLEVRETLANISNQETQEFAKDRRCLYHGRNSKTFVVNNTFKKMLEIWYEKPIKPNWYTIFHKFPSHYASYERALEIAKTGRLSKDDTNEEWKKDRQYMLFLSDLFGPKSGSSALKYFLENRNVDDSRGMITIKGLFEMLAVELGLEKTALEKYYTRYQECFDLLYLLEKQFKYGTLLMYSLTKRALKDFTYVTHDSGGYKRAPVSFQTKNEEGAFSLTETHDSLVIQDALLNIPQRLLNKRYEYIFVAGQDHDSDKNKIGSANPFNPDIDIYHFNAGKDKQIAQTIQKGVALLFNNHIIPDMIKDVIIKDTGNFKEETLTVRSRL